MSEGKSVPIGGNEPPDGAVAGRADILADGSPESDALTSVPKHAKTQVTDRTNDETPRSEDNGAPDEERTVEEANRQRKRRIAAIVCAVSVLLAMGVVAVLSWVSSLGGGTGDPIDTTMPRESTGETDAAAAAAGTDAHANISALEVSFDSKMSLSLSANGQRLSWDADNPAESQARGGMRLSDDGTTVTVSFADSDSPVAISLSVRKAARRFVTWKCGIPVEDGARLSFAGSVTELPEEADIKLDLASLTTSCSPKGTEATPVIAASLSRTSGGGTLVESANASLSLGKGAADASLTTTMREMTMRSAAGVGHGTTLTGMHAVSSPDANSPQPSVGGTVTLDDGVREYVANYDEIAQRATAEKEPEVMPSLVTDTNEKTRNSPSSGNNRPEPIGKPLA